MLQSTLLLAVCGIASTFASPISIEERAAASCTFTGSSGAASAIKAKKSCSTITLNNLAVPAGTTLDLTGLNAGTKVIFQGTTTFGYKEWEGPLVAVSGDKVTVTGASGAVLDGDGSRWWDGKGSNGGKTKPKFFSARDLTDSSISSLTVKNSPVQVFSIDGVNGLVMDKITVDDSAGDSQGGHNTDAFDVGDSTGVYISNAVVQNQDDCLAINSGTNITFTGGSCSGGHGLSIGSVGGRSNNVVKDVHILSSVIKNSDNGVRVKTIAGATGQVSGVTYQDITLSNIKKYGIVIQQDYKNGSPTGKPTSGVPITGLTISNVRGSVTASCTPIYILCGSGACSDWEWEADLSGGKTSTKCLNVPGVASCL